MSSLELNRYRSVAIEVHKIINNKNPIYLSGLVGKKKSVYSTRQDGNLDIPRVNTVKYGQHSWRYLAPKIWKTCQTVARRQYPLLILETVSKLGMVLDLSVNAHFVVINLSQVILSYCF
jgi:hypothetical protein